MPAPLADGYELLRAALRTRLLTVSGIPAQALWSLENREFTKPNVDSATPVVWLRERLAPQANQTASLGDRDRLVRLNGAYFVDLFFPKALGAKPADDLVGAMQQTFAPGSHIVYQTLVVRLRNIWSSTGIATTDGWYMRPVTITWQTDNVTP
jgi:hypothetical protein